MSLGISVHFNKGSKTFTPGTPNPTPTHECQCMGYTLPRSRIRTQVRETEVLDSRIGDMTFKSQNGPLVTPFDTKPCHLDNKRKDEYEHPSRTTVSKEISSRPKGLPSLYPFYPIDPRTSQIIQRKPFM